MEMKNSIKISRQFVRLGEYDMSTTSDGPHRDVMIKKVDFHEDFNGKQMVNDIAIVHMHDHVEFTGKTYQLFDYFCCQRTFCNFFFFVLIVDYVRSNCANLFAHL